jgi:hypothetical protein
MVWVPAGPWWELTCDVPIINTYGTIDPTDWSLTRLPFIIKPVSVTLTDGKLCLASPLCTGHETKVSYVGSGGLFLDGGADALQNFMHALPF